MILCSPARVIPTGFQRYHVEVRQVQTGYGAGKNYERWRRACPSPLPHYEAVVERGTIFGPTGVCKRRGDECAGPGWDDVFGRTPAEAISKARRLAREWVRWQLSLGSTP
jgi:hypothetical protein